VVGAGTPNRSRAKDRGQQLATRLRAEAIMMRLEGGFTTPVSRTASPAPAFQASGRTAPAFGVGILAALVEPSCAIVCKHPRQFLLLAAALASARSAVRCCEAPRRLRIPSIRCEAVTAGSNLSRTSSGLGRTLNRVRSCEAPRHRAQGLGG
jgi:hypothetical protein